MFLAIKRSKMASAMILIVPPHAKTTARHLSAKSGACSAALWRGVIGCPSNDQLSKRILQMENRTPNETCTEFMEKLCRQIFLTRKSP
jgi:hypothetical protein